MIQGISNWKQSLWEERLRQMAKKIKTWYKEASNWVKRERENWNRLFLFLKTTQKVYSLLFNWMFAGHPVTCPGFVRDVKVYQWVLCWLPIILLNTWSRQRFIMHDNKQWAKLIPTFRDEDSSVASDFTEELIISDWRHVNKSPAVHRPGVNYKIITHACLHT